MKERPILFSAPMVRAILAGTKTQTRRILKPQPEAGANFFSVDVALNMAGEPSGLAAWFLDSNEGGLPPVFCPYGQPGDRLWVRETWLHIDDDGDKFDGMGTQTYYRASSMNPERDDAYMKERGLRWRPPIHMPRWASRITLEIVGVRVERLQDISEADAMAEGVALHDDGKFTDYTSPTGYAGNAVSSYRSLWSSINGPGSWEANPWVWCIEFRRVTSD